MVQRSRRCRTVLSGELQQTDDYLRRTYRNGAGKEKPDDTFGYAKLKYQAEGSDEWKELENGKKKLLITGIILIIITACAAGIFSLRQS